MLELLNGIWDGAQFLIGICLVIGVVVLSIGVSALILIKLAQVMGLGV